jgi:hypothetical protein
MQRGKRQLGKRSFPGRLTLEEWLKVPFIERITLIWRAQSDLMGSFRFCAKKRCRRARSCCGDDPGSCRRSVWRIRKAVPKTLRKEWARIDALQSLRRAEGAHNGNGHARTR